jgi:type I restriction enzyme S subunit
VLYSKIRPYLAKAALAPYPGLCSADMYPIEASIESRYLLHWMLSDDFTAFAAAHQGRSVLPKINQAALGTLPIPVAPLPEQQRIVEAIDEALSKLDAGEAGLRTVRLLLKRMRDAVLAAAVTGRLVAQHTTHNPATKLLTDLGVEASTSSALRELPAGWTPSVLGDVAEWSSGGTPKAGTARYYGGCIPWAVIGDLTEGPVWNTASSLTKDGLAESSAKVVPEGTVLLAMYGASIGRIGVAARAMATNQAIACARPRTELIAGSYLFWFLRSQRQAFVEQGKGAAQPNISQTILKGWPIALPPVDEQHRIIAEVERQFSFLEACERAVDVGLASATAVRRSVLKAAFEGKLVPQDPSDEPASILLERIRGERAAASKRARQARTKA